MRERKNVTCIDAPSSLSNTDFLNQIVTQLSSRGWVDPVPDKIHILKCGVVGIESPIRHADIRSIILSSHVLFSQMNIPFNNLPKLDF